MAAKDEGGRTDRQQKPQETQKRHSLADIESCWQSGKLASVARELKEAVSAGGALEQRLIGCADRS